MPRPIAVAVLDDYQGLALRMTDWTDIQSRCEVTVFRDHLKGLDDVARRLSDFDVVCAMRERTPFSQTLFEKLPRLRLLISTGSRNASIDLQAAKRHGVTVCGTGYVGHGAAELTWALILAASKNLCQESTSVRRGGWQEAIGRDLKGSTIGIVGLGNLGRTIARYAAGFEMNLLAWSPNLTEEKAQAAGARLVTKQQLFEASDVVTLHLVLSDRSRGIVGAPELNAMKRTALLVNTSRGPLIDESALITALQTQRIAGAALDVFDEEPLPPEHPFRTLPNVLCTPHIGYVTQETYRIFYSDTVENIRAWLDGKPIRIINAG